MSHWSHSAVFYHIYPLGFCGAIKYHHETEPVFRLDKLADWTPHLKELGVNALYIGPIFESTYHGYDTRDYRLVDHRLGDNAAFAKLCEQLHENGIRVILDGVFNHVGREFWAFRDVQEKGPESPYCSWFQNLNFGGGSPMGDPFWYEGWQGHYDLVKLNLRNPDVVGHLLSAVELWMEEFHIDGLRLDAADCVDMDFFRTLRRFTKERDPDFWLMGEIIHGDYARWANGEMLDSVTNYECWKGNWSAHNTRNYFEIAHSLNRQFGPGGIYQGLCLYNFAENHDVNRLFSTLADKAHLFNVYTLLYTMPGTPSIYYGGEWAIEGSKIHGENADLPLRPELELAEMEKLPQDLCAHLARLAGLRASLPPLREGSYDNIVIKNEQLLFRRSLDGQNVYVCLNLAHEEAFLSFPHPEAELKDLLSGDVVTGEGVVIPPCGGRVLATA